MYDPFLVFRPHFNALARGGYFKIVLNTQETWKSKLHYYYRILVWLLVIMYNLQHVIRAIQVRNNTDRLVGTLFILLTTLNTIGKQISFNYHVNRIDKIVGTIRGSLFAPKNCYHVNLMKKNAKSMHQLLTVYHIISYVSAVLYSSTPFVERALGIKTFFTGYFPFDTNVSPAFEIAVVHLFIILSIQAYGHVTMDCTIVSFYAFAKIQLRMFRYDIEHIVDEIKDRKIYFRYIDEDNLARNMLHKRFVTCVHHYDKIVWFIREIQSIFNKAMLIQLFVMAWVICMTTYKIVGLAVFSLEFLSLAMYLSCMLSQLFIYCYFGTHLKDESELVNDSIYQSEWLLLSPEFRRHLLILMERCKRVIEPRIASIIPMSIDTYISVLRSSYALLTIIDTGKE